MNFPSTERLEFSHYGEMAANGRMDMRGEVGVTSRGVVIQGAMETTCPLSNENCQDANINDRDTFGAHIKVHLYGINY